VVIKTKEFGNLLKNMKLRDFNWNKTPGPMDEQEQDTCEPIYEKYRVADLSTGWPSRLVVFLSILLVLGAVFSIAIMQFDEFHAFINDRREYILNTKKLCSRVNRANIDLISTPIAAFLILLYVILYKRRKFLRKKLPYRNFGLPMIVSCWNKNDRLFSAFTYGLIAFNVYSIVKNSLEGRKTSIFINVKDPTGILPLLVTVFEILVIGVRYYPVLVGKYLILKKLKSFTFQA
jgi:hypothetical protein